MTARVNQPATEWGRRALKLYQRDYARQYRTHDDELRGVGPFQVLSQWIGGIAATCPRGFSALDLGCGTGRYFWALNGASEITGLDASPAMLDEARHPVEAGRITASSIHLVEGDLLTHCFPADRFDLVYSIGVLAEHSPFDARVVRNVATWLKPGGRFAFTTVHPASKSVPRTLGRALGTCGGLYADESRVRELLAAFVIESLTTFESEAHLHCLCVARKPEAGG
jgi:SAM-dependent methyltransferase